ncbi:hypothetical protein PTTG_26600 [Puccinia triticina 1-1 BBBD Race 1]|uniref:Uncharacterized protein n=1 Tax=Puccinia triticina (isolate 1-1 / race 1 (BBBD)) TaxID=630390 RepID=A0A180GS51_PUCT1|nr:hypothetical protein PTTG_26600 [Puccinia triticina 1-1 BBBD Race 1]
MPFGNDPLVIACFPATCEYCNGHTWAGCGLHVDDVLSKIPAGSKKCCCSMRRR